MDGRAAGRLGDGRWLCERLVGDSQEVAAGEAGETAPAALRDAKEALRRAEDA